MKNLKSEFLNEIYLRGFIYQSSEIEDLDRLVSKKKIVGCPIIACFNIN